MHLIDNTSVYETVWSRFGFSGFSEQQKALIPFWKHWALEVLRLLSEGKNVGVIADTGAGKTIIAHFVATARYSRTLFLVPERILGSQHERLLQSMSEKIYSTQTIIGSTPHKKRSWDPTAQFIFTTPQTFVADFNRWKFNPDFDFVIFDELHHGTGEYDYTKIAVLCKALKIPLIGLSASSGKNFEEIDGIAKSMGFDTFCLVPNPNNEKKRFVCPKIIPMDESLKQIESHLSVAIGHVVQKLCEEGLYPARGKSMFILERDLEAIEKRLDAMIPSRKKYSGLFFVGAYRKFYTILKFALTESYDTALMYWNNKLGNDETKSGMFVRQSPHSNAAISIMQTIDRTSHPKIKQLLYLTGSGYAPWVRGIVFVNNRDTGTILTNLLNSLGRKTELIVGRMSVKRQQHHLNQLAKGDIRFIVSTSAIEEGVSVPEIGCVIQYSMPLNEKPRIQRSGRTARVNYGCVDYITLDHPMDKVPFFTSARGEKTMKEISKNYESIKRRRALAPQQLSFFS